MNLKIKEHDIKFGFGLYFLGKAQKIRNEDLGELLRSIAQNPLADVVDLMWLSAEVEAELDEVELSIKKRDFVNYLEEVEDFKNDKGIIAQWSTKLIGTIKGNFLPEDNGNEKEDTSKKK